MRILTLLAVFSLFLLIWLPSGTARACDHAGINPDRIPELLQDSVFIGKVEVMDVRVIQGQKKHIRSYEVTLQPVQAYKGDLTQPLTISTATGGCLKDILPKGSVYEEIITEQEGRLFLSTQTNLLPEDTWMELRNKADNSPLLNNIEGRCAKRGGILVTHPTYFVNVTDCHVAAKDAGKECSKSSQCQGLCLANFSYDRQKEPQPFLYRWSDQNYKPPVLPGRCSAWKDMDGCYHEVKNGKILDTVCKD